MADPNGSEGQKKSGGGGILVPLIIMTVLGVGSGIGFKLFLTDAAPASDHASDDTKHGKKDKTKKTVKAEKAHDGHDSHNKHGADDAHGEKAKDSKHGEHSKEAGVPLIVDVDPVLTSLAGPSAPWVRLEVALIFGSEPEGGTKTVVQQVSGDLLAYLRTVSAAQIEGAEGLEYLTDDLQDIVQVRTHGAVKRLVIKGLVIE